MKRWPATLRDRQARQRGSVLSGLLIMVAFLSILIGALMTELSSAFVVSNAVNGRLQREATESSAVELGLYQLANSSVPPICVRDSRGPWFVGSLNGSPAAVSPSCAAIVPDADVPLAAGSYAVDGTHEVTAVHDSYIVGDQSGALRSYPFGSTSPEWSVSTGGGVIGPPLALPEPDNYPEIGLAVPDASRAPLCGGRCILLYAQHPTGAPSLTCAMSSQGVPTSEPAAEASPTGAPNFPIYVFFGDAGGHLSVNDGSTNASCAQEASQEGLGGAIVGQPLVFTGVSTTLGQATTKTADIFVVISSPSYTQLQEWQYSEATGATTGTTRSLNEVASIDLPVGGLASESNPSSLTPLIGGTIRFAVVGSSGQIVVVRIGVNSSSSGPVYSMSTSGAANVGGPVVSAPHWCQCPGGDSIGVGSTNGMFYMLDTNLNLTHEYSGSAPIRSTPTADANGDWYFGTDDGNVNDIEVPATGMQMFRAAVFPLGGAIRSSPIESGCGTGVCLYFGSSTAGNSFVKIGTARIMDLRACVTSAPSSINCSANPRLWTRAKIGSPSIVGGTGISVVGWSYYYSP